MKRLHKSISLSVKENRRKLGRMALSVENDISKLYSELFS
jgi:hypothetical protein